MPALIKSLQSADVISPLNVPSFTERSTRGAGSFFCGFDSLIALTPLKVPPFTVTLISFFVVCCEIASAAPDVVAPLPFASH